MSSRRKVFYDTETCGFCGPAIIIQYAFDNEEIKIHDCWKLPIRDTLSLIEEMMECVNIGFNLVFDHFQLCKLYTMFSLYHDYDETPESIIEELALLEKEARNGPCLKPFSALDLMLHARKGPYQSTMDRHDIIIKKVPTQLAWQLCQELEERIKLADIYFARKKDKTAQWQVDDIEDDDGQMNPDWKNISLRFRPSSALKALAVDALKLPKDDVLLFTDIEVSKKLYPEELEYAPFALALAKLKGTGSDGKPKYDWKGSWPEVIRHHISHWTYHKVARKYACDDVDYTRRLYHYFDCPEHGDNDSILACAVATTRWRGFRVNLDKILALREKATHANKKIIKKKVEGREIDFEFTIPTAPGPVHYYITEFMDETEKLGYHTKNGTSTKKIILEEVSKMKCTCQSCKGDGTYGAEKIICTECEGKGLVIHPAAIRAKEVLHARMADYEINFYDKLLLAGRLHVDSNIIGALSGRSSGAGGLNAQGIKKSNEVRSSFPLAWFNQRLCGGDFSSFEVSLAEAAYNDPSLRKDLLTCEKCEGKMAFDNDKKDFICESCGKNEGKAIHALFGVFVYPEHDYWSLKKTKGTNDDKYTRSKSGVFALMYGGTDYTLEERLGVPAEIAKNALNQFYRRYPGVRKAQQRIIDAHASMKQVGGIGTRIEWHEPAEYVESLFGFRRYFTLENQICKALYDLGIKPPKKWHNIRIKVQRRDRMQSASGAVQSALFAAAFAVQSSNVRQAVNHQIQSSGAQITKDLQRHIWDLQPVGIGEFIVQCLNVHDEIMCPTKLGHEEQVKKVVNTIVESYRDRVPLIKMDWQIGLESWAEK